MRVVAPGSAVDNSSFLLLFCRVPLLRVHRAVQLLLLASSPFSLRPTKQWRAAAVLLHSFIHVARANDKVSERTGRATRRKRRRGLQWHSSRNGECRTTDEAARPQQPARRAAVPSSMPHRPLPLSFISPRFLVLSLCCPFIRTAPPPFPLASRFPPFRLRSPFLSLPSPPLLLAAAASSRHVVELSRQGGGGRHQGTGRGFRTQLPASSWRSSTSVAAHAPRRSPRFVLAAHSLLPPSSSSSPSS